MTLRISLDSTELVVMASMLSGSMNVQEVVERFEARIIGGEPRCVRHVCDRLSFTDVLLPHRASTMANFRSRGGSRHVSGDASVEDEEEALPNVIRLEDQPKCIKGGRLRDYQARQCPRLWNPLA